MSDEHAGQREPGRGNGDSGSVPIKPDTELDFLRKALLGDVPDRIHSLDERVSRKTLDAQDVSRVLAEAILLRERQDGKLAQALGSSMDEALEVAVRRRPNKVAKAIFPVIGLAIRRAIADSFSRLTQSVNQTLEHSLSPRGLKWRLEAWRTGKPFAEVVMLHTLVYRVEQVFLIHKESGLLLAHAMAGPQQVKTDLISGILSAIQDFVRESFGVAEGESLDALRVGNLTVWFERGPKAVVAGVVRGEPPQELRSKLQEALQNVHLAFREELESFQGDSTLLESAQPLLENCLVQVKREGGKPRRAVFAWAALSALLFVFGLWGFLKIRDERRWQSFVDDLDKTAGVVVVDASKQGGKYRVRGLRDRLAEDPGVLKKLIDRAGMNPEELEFSWERFYALDEDIVAARVGKLLQPPETVEWTLQAGVLTVSGEAQASWVERLRAIASAVPGIDELREENLVARGLVPNLRVAVDSVDSFRIQFARNSQTIAPPEKKRVEDLAVAIKDLLEFASRERREVVIEMVGSSQAGGRRVHTTLGKDRSEAVKALLVASGVPAERLRVRVYDMATGTPPPEDGDGSLRREVALRVVFTDDLSTR